MRGKSPCKWWLASQSFLCLYSALLEFGVIACNSLSCTLLLIVYYVFTFRHYLTSSKIIIAEYQ